MIKIDDRYVITADAWGATLKKIIKPDDADEALLKRFGIERSTKDKIRIVGHYVTLEGALKGYMQERYNCRLKNFTNNNPVPLGKKAFLEPIDGIFLCDG